MNIQPDIFDYLETTSLEPHDDYTSTFTYAEQKQIWNRIKSQEQEIERLHNIIKEVREYIEKNEWLLKEMGFHYKDIYKILDKTGLEGK